MGALLEAIKQNKSLRYIDSLIVVNPGDIFYELRRTEDILKRFEFEECSFAEINELGNIVKGSTRKKILIDNISTPKAGNEYERHRFMFPDIDLMSVSDFIESFANKIPVINVNDTWVAPRNTLYLNVSESKQKIARFFDLAISILFAPIILLLLAIGILVVKFSSKGPIFFKQLRTGKNGKPFVIYKLRTMQHDLEEFANHTIVNDSRITSAGKYLRKMKIDELPQIFNIIKGDMSYIGPRPERIEIVKELTLENPFYHLRHVVRPGLSGWAQINEPTATPLESFSKLQYDLYFIKNFNFLLFFRIFLSTLRVVFKGQSL